MQSFDQPREMNADAELLQDILDEAPAALDGQPVTVKAITHWTGYASQTISDYRIGRLTIPTRFWRCLFNHYPNPRILQTISGDWECDIYNRCADISDQPEMLRRASELMGEFADLQKYFADICADGRINETDADAVRQFNRKYAQMRMLSGQLVRAVNTTFKQNQGRVCQ